MQIYCIVHKGLEHPQNLLSTGVLEASPRTLREDSTNLNQAPSGSYTLSFFFFFFALLFSSILLLSCNVLPTFENCLNPFSKKTEHK